jgi:hypothetical protein
VPRIDPFNLKIECVISAELARVHITNRDNTGGEAKAVAGKNSRPNRRLKQVPGV